jgi:nucleotide-binding universal stress UspA family protein
MKILLAVDSSPQSEVVVAGLMARPWPAGTEVCVLTVVDMIAMLGVAVAGMFQPFASQESTAAQSLVYSIRGRLESCGLRASAKVLEDYPATAIADYAQRWKADFIFVGSNGHSGIARFLPGAVARAVVQNAPCSVEIVRPGTRGASGEHRSGMRILLATDGSDYSVAATRSIADRPWPTDTEVRVVSVVDLVIPATDPWYAAGEVIDRIREENTRASNEAADAAQATLRAAGLEAGSSVLAGKPKWRIVDEAKEWGADLIVVGSHGRRGMTRVLLGSVSEAVAMHAECSVEVVRMRH